MKTFISKPSLLYAFLLLIIIILLMSVVAANIFLMANKEKIEQELSHYLKHTTSLGSIYYVPPSFVILKDVYLEYKDAKEEYSPLSSSKIALTLSLNEMINKKNIVVSRVNFIRPKIDFYEHPVFLKEKMERVIKIITMLAQDGPLKVTLDEADCIYKRDADEVMMLKVNAKLNVAANKKIESWGEVSFFKFKQAEDNRLLKQALFPPHLLYRFSGGLTPEQLDIYNVEVYSNNFQLKFNGELKDNILILKGNSTIEKFYKSSGASDADKKRELLKQINSVFRYGRFSQKVEVPTDNSINLSGINLSLSFSPEAIAADTLEFYCDDVPVRATGKISFLDNISARLKVSTFADSAKGLEENDPRRFDALLECNIIERKVDGQLDIGFFKEKTKQNINLLFSNLSFGMLPDARIRILIEESMLQYSDGGDVFNLLFKEFSSMLNFANKTIKFATFKSMIYEGGLNGHVACNLSTDPFTVSYNLKIDKLNAEKIDSLLLHLFGAYRNLSGKLSGNLAGKFSCALDYINYPSPRLQGEATIKNGYLDNINFFVWLSDFFKIPELKGFNFNNLFLEFESTKKSTSFQNVKLEADKILMEGNFNIKENDLVSSNVSLLLPRAVLATSPKFNLLLALISKQTDSLSFDFQLSGVYNALNFKWMESEFKQKIKRMLPGFIERDIERKIEKAIDSISN